MMSDEVLGVADIHEILRLLPHRYPFLLVDRVIGMRGDEHGVGIKHVSMNEPQFVGHFPENPVMPGVLVIEGMAQTACVLALRLMPPTDRRRVMFFLTIDKAKFRKPARPGDTLEYHVDKITQRRNMWWYRGEAKVDDVLVAEAELGAYLAEE
ncbi:MAG: 3-hydroxyacyl-ACP dehydratase FabZ [Xanthobacteraceae bacterium]